MASVLEFDRSIAHAVRSALNSDAVVFSDASQIVNYVRETSDPLVVIGPSVDAGVACRLTEQVSAAHPAAGVIWLRRRVDTTTVLAAIRAGASDVVAESDLPALVVAAARVIARASAFAAQTDANAAKARATVTAVYASKGGCGKTSIATNLAALIAREHHKRVGLIDMDLESGDVQLLMALPQARCITDLISLADSMDTSSLAAAMMTHPSGTYVLAAPHRPEDAATISPKLVGRILGLATSIFDHVIIDCPPYATEHVLTVMDHADHVALICMPDAPSVKNTALALEMFNELNFSGQVSLVINHAGDKVGITTADIAHALEYPVSLEIPSSLDLPTATNHGRLLTLSHPRHPISNSIREYAETLERSPTNPQGPRLLKEAPAAAPAKRSRFGFRRVATA